MQTAGGALQEPVQGSAERGELAQLPAKDTASTDTTSDASSPRALTFDLFDMVISYKRMAIFLEPVTDAVEVVRYLLGWRMPLCSLLCCVVLNILFLTLSDVAWFSLCLLAVSAPAVLGYLGDRCQGVTTETAVQKKRYHAVQRRDFQTVHMTRQEAMMEVKVLLKQLDDLMTQACAYAERVHKVVYWDSSSASSVFYGSLLALVCMLYTAPVGWVLALANSTLFLWNRDFCRVVLELKELVVPGQEQQTEGETDRSEPDQTSLPDRTPTPTSLEDLSPGSVEEAEEAEPDDEYKDAIEDDDEVPSGAPDYDSVSDNGLLSRNEPIRSKVSKLTERLRKRYPTNPTGNCSNCAAAFSVLKKRRSCSNCGNSFCSRCCSYKVFRSSMGATAPEAQRETVFVCAMCNGILSKKD
ncbi:protrudin [Chanos chanos]|uniref:Protrudin n=1 Tax=Chanos chanos TaxID=29144 RepID=A0A6J2VTW5_CHACN|nr:protrudin [Chanos chanos]